MSSDAYRVEHMGEVLVDQIKVIDRAREDMGDETSGEGESLEGLAESMRVNGLIHSIVVDEKMRLLAGGRRLSAAKLLKWPTIRTDKFHIGNNPNAKKIVEDHENYFRKSLTWAEKAKLQKSIYDGIKSKNPKWSERDQETLMGQSHGKVNKELRLAEMLEVAPEMATEFKTQEEAWKTYEDLEERTMTIAAKKNRPEEVVHAPKWAREHFIIGDAVDGMGLCKEGIADFAEIDPPYAIEIDRRKGDRNIDKGHIGDYNEVDIKAYPSLMKQVIVHVHRLLKDNTFAVFWFGTQWHCDMRQWLTAAGFAVNSTPAIWYKGAMGQTAQPDVMLASSYEPFFLARKGQPRMRRQGRSNVFHYSPLAPSKKGHSTERPLDLMVDILDTMLFPGCNVLVPFLGSGVTLRAAYKLGHTGFGFDKSEAHKERFLQRVGEEYTELVE